MSIMLLLFFLFILAYFQLIYIKENREGVVMIVIHMGVCWRKERRNNYKSDEKRRGSNFFLKTSKVIIKTWIRHANRVM